ncbi:MAG: Gfo/Idh/MocA family oxidoreductase [Verrucomicrobiales bacterium]|nr:Gfo/Idh/MocA family oxidoreductase [Verrucomicrobiales bacterium]
MNRRSFLRNSLLVTASLSAWPRLGWSAQSAARVRGANEDIRVAVVGFNGRGRNLIDGLRKLKGVRVVALCDVDSEVLARGVREFEQRNEKVAAYRDVRKLLEDPDVDVVGIATPNHWHSLAAIWAVQAGKDVYLEKPGSHNVWEGRKTLEAARKYQRIVQIGTQSRSSTGLAEAFAWLQQGHLGKILRARGFCYKRRPSIGKVDGPQPIPESVDYDLWCGPAPKEPLMRKRLHYDWHWVWPTGNGDIGNQGVHQMDMCRWALGQAQLPSAVWSIGERLGYVDDGTTPNTQIVFYDYRPAPLIFEVRGLPADPSKGDEMDNYRGVRVGVVIECEAGYMTVKSYSSAEAYENSGDLIRKFEGGGDHFENFIKAVRSRKTTDLNADVSEGRLSAALCHLGNISHRVGQKLPPAAIRDAIRNNADLAEAFGRMEEHLKINAVDLVKTPATLGALLKFDPRKEKFLNNSAANELLTRQYRAPFVVPEKV